MQVLRRFLSLLVFLGIAGSGATGVCQLDRVYEEGLVSMIQRVQSLSYHYEGRLELHVIGGFADNKAISHQLSTALLRKSCALWWQIKIFILFNEAIYDSLVYT